ncbi:hypothetical protein EOI86_19305 [Hwanghaeella grinnelliae]|uniref:Co-chaperone DjlA N-terminal domain-containing protein n=1 Tax=Hwanghaeella grinnelliae TaxID=2500179 RepID=A0A437QKE7_9PROT|nr:tellurite resistance TerB family protein [Hwanghaeella grinnelliae]RVU34983.1 hypothetical protein EOI86_19305 [Hwanghaeella grinnelliae]
MISKHDALIYTMVITSAADQEMTDAELQTIGDVVRHLPAFRDFDVQTLPTVSAQCAEMLTEEDGLESVLNQVHAALPESLRETAYALAVDVAAADLHAAQEELRILEMLRYHLEIDRLTAAAIERGARARYRAG